MAEQNNQPIEMIPVAAGDIMPERMAMWEGFNRFSAIGIGVVVAILVLMAIFLL
jgi:heme A synthase